MRRESSNRRRFAANATFLSFNLRNKTCIFQSITRTLSKKYFSIFQLTAVYKTSKVLADRICIHTPTAQIIDGKTSILSKSQQMRSIKKRRHNEPLPVNRFPSLYYLSFSPSLSIDSFLSTVHQCSLPVHEKAFYFISLAKKLMS